MMDSERLEKFEYLFFRYSDGSITEEEMDLLNAAMLEDEYVQEKYFDFSNTVFVLNHCLERAISIDDNPSVSLKDLESLARYEKTAPLIDVSREPQRELIQKVVREEVHYKLSKSSLFTLIVSVAAILLIVLFAKYAPDNRYRVDVATLLDQTDTRWAPSEMNLETGSRLWTHESPLQLNKGIVKIQYDDGVDVLIEGPAVFEIERSGIHLEYGRLYSRVSEAGLGFTVATPTTQFVDHGTEFGVQADVNGSAELHVIKGKVQLFSDLRGSSRASQLINQNEAVRYDANQGQVQSIPVSKRAFVRAFDSNAGIAWRGQTSIDLGDIASGGDGLTITRRPVTIHPNTGAFSFRVEDFEGEGQIESHTGDFTYQPIEENPFVDGVFIPSIEQGLPEVTTAGHVFADCPSTGNTFWEALFYTKYFKTSQHNLTIAEMVEVHKQDALFMHANSGITFDLDKMRSAYSFGTVKAFRAACLVNRETRNPSDSDSLRTVDFWVLVDGQVRYQKIDVTHSETAYPISFEISEKDRFLTLVVTDGSDDNAGLDWGFFMEPVLLFQE